MTDFVTQITNGNNGSAFASWYAGIPATVPVGDRYIAELSVQDLNEYPDFGAGSKQIDGDVILRALSSAKHSGTRNTGMKVTRSTVFTGDLIRFTAAITGTGRIIIEDLEIIWATGQNTATRIIDPTGAVTPTVIMQRCLITNNNIAGTRPINISCNRLHFLSNRYWDESGNAGTRMASGFFDSTAAHEHIVQGNVFQSTIDVQRGISLQYGASTLANSLLDVQGNIVLDTVEDYRVDVGASAAVLVFAQNVSEDLTGQVTGATLVNDLVSVNNPDVKTGSIALVIWTNKPTTYGAQIDVYGLNRTTVAGSAEWDAGSMQFSTAVVPPPVTSVVLDRAVGSFGSGVGAIGSTVVVPLPFSMKAVKLWYSGIETAADGVTTKTSSAGTGFASADKGIFTNGASAAMWIGGFSDPFAYRRINTQNCVIRISTSSAGNPQGAMQLQSVTPTDMTFVITEQFLFDLQISFLALGGDAVVDAIVTNFDHNGSVGVQQVTGVPFQPTVGMLAHVSINDGGVGNNLTTGGNLGLGVATSLASWVSNVWMGNKTGQVDATRYFKTDEWFATAEADVIDRSIWSAWNADGFDIDHIEASGATPTIIALLMNIASVEVGTLLTKIDGTDIVSATGFTAKAWLFGSCGTPENTVNVIGAGAELTLGGATSQTDQRAQGVHSPDGAPSSLVNLAINDGALFIKSDDALATVKALMSLKATSPTDFTTVMDVPEPVEASIVGCVIYGDDDTPDDQTDPVGSALLDLADNETVDLRHPLTLILEGVDSDALQVLASGIPIIQGTEQGITLDVLSDPEEDSLFPILSSTVAPIFLVEGVGDISIAPLGSTLLPVAFEDDLSLSILDTDHDTIVVGSALSAAISGEGGVVTFLFAPTGATLDPVGSSLGQKAGGLVDPIASYPPAITISRPTDPGANITLPPLTRDVVVASIRDVVLNF